MPQYNVLKQPVTFTSDLILVSSTGKQFKLDVDDTGRLTTTLVGQPSTAAMPFAPVTGYGESSVYNPTGTANTSWTMMGMGLVSAMVSGTATVATAAWVTCDGQITNNSNNGETDIIICYGTGTSPMNGAPLTGTVASQSARYKATAANDFVPFSLTALIEGLVGGTVYWFDLAMKTVGGGTGKVTEVDFSVHGLA